MYKLAVLDIDGTLVDDRGNVSKKTIETIREVKRNGGIVTICTGRNIRKAMPVVKKAGIDVPFVCMDGSIMYDPINEKIIYGFELSREEIFNIVDAAKDKNALIELSDGNTYFKYIKNKGLYKYDIFNNHNLFGRVKSYIGGIRYLKNLSQVLKLDIPFYQVVVGADENTVADIRDEINSKNLDRVEVRDYLWKEYIFINRKGIKKSSGVKLLCDYFNVCMDEVITIGDERNDIDMIEMAGMGVAMGNAVKSVKNVADYITLGNNENGAAAALEKFFLI